LRSAPFTPQKSGIQPGAGGDYHVQPIVELPVKQFFFARLDLIEHLLAWREEELALDSSAYIDYTNTLG